MAEDITKKRVVVFGIFDGAREGHRDLFRAAHKTVFDKEGRARYTKVIWLKQ